MKANNSELKAPPPVPGSDPTLADQDLSEVVMAIKTRGWTKKAPRDKAGTLRLAGQRDGGHLSSTTLGIALSTMVRLPKPRNSEGVDDTVWAAARLTAEEELTEKLGNGYKTGM